MAVLQVRYPTDNDLDEVAWLARNLDFARPESFANLNYPLGFPVLLRVVTPLFGDFLVAVFTVQALAMTAVLASVFFLGKHLVRSFAAAVLAAAAAALFTATFATTEFADGPAAAFALAGFAYAFPRGRSARGALGLRAGIGAAFLFRFHYLAVLPMALGIAAGLADRAWPARLRTVALCAAGFALAAWPLLLVNTLVRGNPVDTGISTYAGHFVMGGLDWNNFPATYARWPLGRVLAEHPDRLVAHMVRTARSLVHVRPVLVAGVLAPFAVLAARRHGVTRSGVALAAFMVL